VKGSCVAVNLLLYLFRDFLKLSESEVSWLASCNWYFNVFSIEVKSEVLALRVNFLLYPFHMFFTLSKVSGALTSLIIAFLKVIPSSSII